MLQIFEDEFDSPKEEATATPGDTGSMLSKDTSEDTPF